MSSGVLTSHPAGEARPVLWLSIYSHSRQSCGFSEMEAGAPCQEASSHAEDEETCSGPRPAPKVPRRPGCLLLLQLSVQGRRQKACSSGQGEGQLFSPKATWPHKGTHRLHDWDKSPNLSKPWRLHPQLGQRHVSQRITVIAEVSTYTGPGPQDAFNQCTAVR